MVISTLSLIPSREFCKTACRKIREPMTERVMVMTRTAAAETTPFRVKFIQPAFKILLKFPICDLYELRILYESTKRIKYLYCSYFRNFSYFVDHYYFIVTSISTPEGKFKLVRDSIVF